MFPEQTDELQHRSKRFEKELHVRNLPSLFVSGSLRTWKCYAWIRLDVESRILESGIFVESR